MDGAHQVSTHDVLPSQVHPAHTLLFIFMHYKTATSVQVVDLFLVFAAFKEMSIHDLVQNSFQCIM